jgi:hypothetical protein
LSSKNHTSITISAFETESLFSLVFFLFPLQTHIYKIGREFSENGNELETCKSLLVFLEKKGVELKKSSLFKKNESSFSTIPEVMDFQFWRFKIRYVLFFSRNGE